MVDTSERAELMERRVEYLASDELTGRAPGTEGGLLAREYVRPLSPISSWSRLETMAAMNMPLHRSAVPTCSVRFPDTDPGPSSI